MRIILGAACVAALISSTTGVSATTDLPGFLPELSAGTIAVISDGEFVAQTYAMGRLAPAGAGLRDRLTILTIEDGTVRTASLNVSNSVTAAPEVIALTPDGATAFVVERLGERPAGGETVRDLSPGNRLFAVDLSDKANPVIADTIEIARSLRRSPSAHKVTGWRSSRIPRTRAIFRSLPSPTAGSGKSRGSAWAISAWRARLPDRAAA